MISSYAAQARQGWHARCQVSWIGQVESVLACWPSRQAIWEWLTREPLAPVTVMVQKKLPGKGLAWPAGRHACRIRALSVHTATRQQHWSGPRTQLQVMLAVSG